ncbi:SEC-C domain-containing protein [Pseudomonas sp. WS 5406]|uniref:SEC-C domain-containing protein n=1 Tax=unclassified Pseudomonas TaxID=196821 RepID=UPI0014729C37|nr:MULTISPECIES: SEC-C domain-containing protein [unclassified Pseudomonas]NMX24995.1 SEC-C domain-containing protein [Pseudomonas sp. WS 5406]
MGFKRNELCWCGSGLKYKKCHLDRGSETPVSVADAHRTIKKINTSKTCSAPSVWHPNCTVKIINAHTVSKSSSLKEISVEGHVLAFLGNVQSITKTNKLAPARVGINRASTFSGFCSHHDKVLFSPVEDCPFYINKQHCFLVAFRAVSRELYVKGDVSEIFQDLKGFDKGQSLMQQLMLQRAANEMISNNNLSKSDLAYIKEKLDDMLVGEDYSELKHVVFELAHPPHIMGSSIVAPIYGFDGEPVQFISHNKGSVPDYVIINSFSDAGKGYIVFSWLPEHSTTGLKLVGQFRNANLSSDNLAVFMLQLLENIYLHPAWWAGLDGSMQEYICDIFSEGLTCDMAARSLINVRSLGMPSIVNIDTTLML